MRARWLRHHPLCVRCLAIGRVTAAQEVDHVIPLFKGGPDKWDNLQSLCRLCHVDKTCEDKGIVRSAETGLDGWPVDGTGSERRGR